MRHRFLLPVLLAVAGQPAPFPPAPFPPRPDPALVAAQAEARMYREATERFAVLHGKPTPGQWKVIKQDLDAIPPGARHWLRLNGRPVVIVSGDIADEWPGYEAYRGVSGVGWPTPVVSLKWAYPVTGNGVAIGGKSVVLHEVGHTLGFLMDGTFGRDLQNIRSNSAAWRAAWARQDWSQLGPYYGRNPEEGHAESFAIWCMVRKGGFEQRLPAGVDLGPILAYWDQTAREAGWVR